jgi:hypothetical protein
MIDQELDPALAFGQRKHRLLIHNNQEYFDFDMIPTTGHFVVVE